MALIREIGADGAAGHVIEYAGGAISRDERRRPADRVQHERRSRRARRHRSRRTTRSFEYLHGRPRAPRGAQWDAAVARWKTLRSDDDARVRCATVRLDASRHRADGDVGHESGPGVGHRRRRARSGAGKRRDPTRATCSARSSTWVLRRASGWTRSASTTRSSARAPTAASRTCATPRASCAGAGSRAGVRAHGRARLDRGARAGRSGRPRPGVPRRRLRMAAVRLLDVRRDERRPPRCPASAARRQHQSQFRRPAGRGRAHAPDEPRDGGGGRGRRPPHRRAPLRLRPTHGAVHDRHRRGRAAAAREHRHRPDHAQAVPARASIAAGSPTGSCSTCASRRRACRGPSSSSTASRGRDAKFLVVGAELRLRLAAASTRCGACAQLGIRAVIGTQLRRHLLRQLPAQRRAGDPLAGRRGRAA